ncbi:hypothetical protein GCM10018987_18000 [Streptomyces cremeus]
MQFNSGRHVEKGLEGLEFAVGAASLTQPVGDAATPGARWEPGSLSWRSPSPSSPSRACRAAGQGLEGLEFGHRRPIERLLGGCLRGRRVSGPPVGPGPGGNGP